jgi:hypothetical protein
MEDKIEQKVETIIIKKWHVIVGTLTFLVTFVAPLIVFGTRLDKNQALQAQSINTINLNHEAHMQTALEEISELKKSDSELRKKLDTDHDAIIRLLEMHQK